MRTLKNGVNNFSSLKKVMFIIGTRPEAIKMAPLIIEMRKYDQYFKSIVVTTAQHRQMLDSVLSLFGIMVDFDLNIMRKDQKLCDVSVRAIGGLSKVIEEVKPNFVFVQGDTITTLMGALAAFYQRVPIGHVEAGLRSNDKYNPFPEEMDRRITSVLADLHFAPTIQAKKNLLKEGILPNTIYVTGNTVIDALQMIVKKDYQFECPSLNEINFMRKVILITAHRRENLGIPLKNICQAIVTVINQYPEIEVVYPVHLNPHVEKVVRNMLGNLSRVHLVEPLNYQSMVNLMSKSYLILTDSGGIQEEAPSLGKPVLVMRKVTERPEGVKAGTVKLVGTEVDNMVKEVSLLLNSSLEYNRMAKAVNPYGDGKASLRIAKILLNTLNSKEDYLTRLNKKDKFRG